MNGGDPGSYLLLDPGLKESRFSDKTTNIAAAARVLKIKVFEYLFGCWLIGVGANEYAFFRLREIASRGAVRDE